MTSRRRNHRRRRTTTLPVLKKPAKTVLKAVTGTNPAETPSRPSRCSLRHAKICCREIPCRRAVAEAIREPERLSATIRNFSFPVQRRRRPDHGGEPIGCLPEDTASWAAAWGLAPGAEILVAHAKAKRCDMIFIGSRGMGAARNLLLGSTVAKVLQLAGVPVLVAR